MDEMKEKFQDFLKKYNEQFKMMKQYIEDEIKVLEERIEQLTILAPMKANALK